MARTKKIVSYVVFPALLLVGAYQSRQAKDKAEDQPVKTPAQQEYEAHVQRRAEMTAEYTRARDQIDAKILRELVAVQPDRNMSAGDKELRAAYNEMRELNLNYMNQLDSINRVIENAWYPAYGARQGR